MSEKASPEVTSLAAWKKAKFHNILLPSGVRVEIQIPDLAALIAAGEIPQNLLDAALEAAGESGRKRKQPDKEFYERESEFTDRLVQIAVTKPKLTDDEVKDIPFEDKVLISEIATRRIDFDAEGSHIAGLDTSEKFRKFRGLDKFESAIEDF